MPLNDLPERTTEPSPGCLVAAIVLAILAFAGLLVFLYVVNGLGSLDDTSPPTPARVTR